MRRDINGKTYDSSCSVSFFVYDNNKPIDDPEYISERLMRTSRDWLPFLYCSGGADSQYARSCKNGFRAGKTIIPLDESEVIEYLECREKGKKLSPRLELKLCNY